jgi:hypothetical protein
MFSDKVIGTREIKLSDLLGKQLQQGAYDLQPGCWGVKHRVVVPTTLRDKRKAARRMGNGTSSGNSSSWLETAKSATNSLTASATPGGGLNITAEKQKARMLDAEEQARGASSYTAVPSDAAGKFASKRVQAEVHFEFRLVQLQGCLQLNLTADTPAIMTPDTPGTVSDTARAGIAPGMEKDCISISELHLLAATAPASMTVDVMRALSRKHSLPDALALRSAVYSPKAGAEKIASVSSGGNRAQTRPPLHPRSTGTRSAGTPISGPSASSAAVECPLRCVTPFALALLFQQDVTVLEMLQRCGSLCFAGIEPECATPLHAAVRGGSATCVEYVGRYLKKYGSRRVTGSGARLWNSSLSAKLEWRDNQDDTALALLCRRSHMQNAHAIAVYLLILGSDPAAVNGQSKWTPLMYACKSGPPLLVSTLLSIVKSYQDITDGILNVGDVNSILNNTTSLDVDAGVREELQNAIAASAQAARSSALARHLYTNARSSNILRGRNPAEGGFLNPLTAHVCEPGKKESQLGRNALHIAVERGDGEIVQMLLDIGMTCVDTDYKGENVMHIACRRGGKGLVAKLAECEVKEWAAYKELVKQGKSLELMRHRNQALLSRNCAGETPVDIALEGRHFGAAAEVLGAVAKAYGAIPPRLARGYYATLERDALMNSYTPTASAMTPETSSKSGTKGTSSKTNSPVRASPGAKAAATLERHFGSCVRILLPYVADISSGLPTGEQRDLADGALDNHADTVEYMLALSPLGLKYITDSAGAGAVSYLPSEAGTPAMSVTPVTPTSAAATPPKAEARREAEEVKSADV